MSDKLQRAIGYVLGVILFFIAWPLGVYHAFTAHGVGHAALGVGVPPYAWYRAAEFFWHSDHVQKVGGKEGAVEFLTTKCKKNDDEFQKVVWSERNIICSVLVIQRSWLKAIPIQKVITLKSMGKIHQNWSILPGLLLNNASRWSGINHCPK